MSVLDTCKKDLYVIIIAHPDDESMFFLPTIRFLVEEGKCEVWLLCLTTGNYDGLGSIRSNELRRCCLDVLNINKVILLGDHEHSSSSTLSSLTLEDHPTKAWSIEDAELCIVRSLQEALDGVNAGMSSPSSDDHESKKNRWRVIHLITFDEGGVSGHVNHRDTYFAVRQLFLQQEHATAERHQKNENYMSSSGLPTSSVSLAGVSIKAWSLETVRNPIVKYIPVYEWVLLLLHWCFPKWIPTHSSTGKENDDGRIIYRMHEPSLFRTNELHAELD